MAAKAQAAKRKSAAGTKTPAKRKTTAGKSAARSKSATRGKGAARHRPEAGKRGPAGRAGKRVEHPLMKALRAEHRHISGVMSLFGDQLKAVEEGQLVDTHVIYEIMDYMVSWPDRYHHPREDMVYGRVSEVDAGAADEVDTLQRDHDRSAARGREVLAKIERWRRGEVSGESVIEAGRAYIDHILEHMNIEEKVVFPHIESILSNEDWRELAEDDQLRPAEDPVFGPRVQREYRNLARKLRRNVRRGVEHGTMVEWIAIEALMESLEVLSIALQSARNSAGDHVRAIWEDSRDLLRESPLKAPVQCTVNSVKMAKRLLEDVADISRDTLDDLSRVNRERQDRIRLLNR